MPHAAASPIFSAQFVHVQDTCCEERDRIIQEYLGAVALRNAITALRDLGKVQGQKVCTPELEDASTRCKELQRVLVEHCLHHGC